MNIYQKLLNKNVTLAKICYNNLFKDVPNYKETYRWHRAQTRVMLKTDKENSIESLRKLNVEYRQNLIECGWIKANQ